MNHYNSNEIAGLGVIDGFSCEGHSFSTDGTNSCQIISRPGKLRAIQIFIKGTALSVNSSQIYLIVNDRNPIREVVVGTVNRIGAISWEIRIVSGYDVTILCRGFFHKCVIISVKCQISLIAFCCNVRDNASSWIRSRFT